MTPDESRFPNVSTSAGLRDTVFRLLHAQSKSQSQEGGRSASTTLITKSNNDWEETCVVLVSQSQKEWASGAPPSARMKCIFNGSANVFH